MIGPHHRFQLLSTRCALEAVVLCLSWQEPCHPSGNLAHLWLLRAFRDDFRLFTSQVNGIFFRKNIGRGHGGSGVEARLGIPMSRVAVPAPSPDSSCLRMQLPAAAPGRWWVSARPVCKTELSLCTAKYTKMFLAVRILKNWIIFTALARTLLVKIALVFLNLKHLSEETPLAA